MTGVQHGVEVEERPFKLGERIPLSVKFTNSTAMPRFPVGPIHLAGQVTVLDARQQPIRRREDLRLEAQAKAGKVVGAIRKPPPMYSAAIKPSGILGYGLDLAKEFVLDQPGTYHVSATGHVLSGLPFEQGSVTHPLTSGTVVVQITSNAPPSLAVAPVGPAAVPTNAPTLRPSVPSQPEVPTAAVITPPPQTLHPAPPEPAVTPAPTRTSLHFSGTLVLAGVFGILGLLVLYWMFRSDPR